MTEKTRAKPPNIERIVARVEDLPTLPVIVLRITELVNNPKSSAKDLAGIITDDQVLTARLLKLVNSSFYGFPQKISTVTGAIVLLGFDAIRNLLLTTSIFDLFSNNDKKYRARLERLWDHSLGCAIGAKVIGSYLRYDKIEELFVTGLLHDIGKIVEILFLETGFSEVSKLVEEKNALIVAAEDQVLGFNHAEVGRQLAERWNLPSKLVSVIANHHCPDMAGEFSLEAAAVHLADVLCRAMEIGSGGDNRVPPLDRHAWDILQLDVGLLEPVMEEIEEEFEDVGMFATQSSR